MQAANCRAPACPSVHHCQDTDLVLVWYRRRALELVYALVNEGNIKTLTKELLDYLKISDLEFKPDLTNKVCMLIQRFAPDKQWHLDSLLQVGLHCEGSLKTPSHIPACLS